MALSQPPLDRSAAKLALRDQILAARGRRSLADVGAEARRLATVLLSDAAVGRAATVAAYVAVGTEPGTTWVRDALREAGIRVLLPVLQPDGDLDWGLDLGDDSLATARLGLLEPTGTTLGPDAVATADVVLVPGLAVSSSGMRLGRGGGSYDRALARVPVGTPVYCLLYDDEVGHDVPVEPHDRSVTAAATPSGVVVLG
ncbi:5-formyltetrahydrofolate cyclo-ligase [Nocardioides sp. R-C-SC26]|uniref:5-formyltetrahydrofolate cyclo-ligase n=1 Tax=Nocardioides sp. R-C-SC26 TaxID=2870414 RepID=UPI001E2B8F33|nr:5-formyltetrahydrofolate cyclo-ligase [Nocardioides sp. R-C-SC26]